jgi:para-aminobenzoate synthetase component 1
MYRLLHIKNGRNNDFKSRLLKLSDNFDIFSIYDSNNWPDDRYHQYDVLAAFGSEKEIRCTAGNAFESLRSFQRETKDWLFGYLAYDLKNETEKLFSRNKDGIDAPDLFFFQPSVLIVQKGGELEVLLNEAHSKDSALAALIQSVFESGPAESNIKDCKAVHIANRMSKDEYLQAVDAIRKHIKRGDVYELNYCQEFYAEQAEIHPQSVFQKLIKKSPTPFSAFCRINEIYVMSASPERYIRKEGDYIISQPIKGTARRVADVQRDKEVRAQLQNDIKERAENIMIVDLVRNDLTHIARPNSVQVEELCGIYSFEQVHQMISTVSARLKSDADFVDVLRHTFPMGSMTGAPKIRAMQLIEQYEKSKRGIYSGAVGYITPDGDFDFSVVIRSLIYNQKNKYLSFIAGGAITYRSEPEKEYEESLLKAEAIRQILE